MGIVTCRQESLRATVYVIATLFPITEGIVHHPMHLPCVDVLTEDLKCMNSFSVSHPVRWVLFYTHLQLVCMPGSVSRTSLAM